VPGLLINLQEFTIDYDAVAYRTSVILVEDPGQKSDTTTSWEVEPFYGNYNKSTVQRFGLAVSRDTPNILSLDKVNRFFNTSIFDDPDDYHNRAIFGDYPYRYNISLRYINEPESARSIGEVLPEGYGYSRRFVKIKSISNASIDASTPALVNVLNQTGYINGDNETIHVFSVLMNNTNLARQIKNPAYQIIPAKESFMINLINLNSTMYDDRRDCFNITLKSGDIWVSDGNNTRNFNEPIIDEVPAYLTNTPQQVKHNVSVVYNTTSDRKGVDWEASQIYINFKFNLINTNSACFCSTCPGSRFLNNTYTYPFDYNYETNNVTQPQLRDAVVEVAIW
jgi:hypothetical protein